MSMGQTFTKRLTYLSEEGGKGESESFSGYACKECNMKSKSLQTHSRLLWHRIAVRGLHLRGGSWRIKQAFNSLTVLPIDYYFMSCGYQ